MRRLNLVIISATYRHLPPYTRQLVLRSLLLLVNRLSWPSHIWHVSLSTSCMDDNQPCQCMKMKTMPLSLKNIFCESLPSPIGLTLFPSCFQFVRGQHTEPPPLSPTPVLDRFSPSTPVLDCFSLLYSHYIAYIATCPIQRMVLCLWSETSTLSE